MIFERQKYKDVLVKDIGIYDTIQLKYDGIWALVETKNGRARIYSRSGQLKHTLPCKLPDGSFVGEFMYGSQWSQDATRKGRIFLFDCLECFGDHYAEQPYRLRYSILSKAVNSNVSDPNFYVVTNYRLQHFSLLWERMVTNGSWEGLVFRRSSDPWEATVGRLKKEIQEDYYIVAFHKGQGKHEGRLGALGVALQPSSPELMRVGGGFSDDERERIWNAREDYMGRCISVTGKARFASGALRHPCFKGFHNEK